LSLPRFAFHGGATMIIVFNCPHCAAILRMKEQYGGQRGRCPHCQGAITVPAIETEAGMDLIPLDGGAPASSPAATETPPSASTSLFSIESRLRSLGGASATDPAAGAPRPSDTGDSNIGLAPVDDFPTPAAKAPPPKPPAPVRSVEEEPDENFALAPLDEAVARPTVAAATVSAAKEDASAAKNGDSATSDSKSDLRISVVCDGCGARMRVPPTAAGRQLGCPRCKKKLRVPDAPESVQSAASAKGGRGARASSAAVSDSSSRELDIGALDEIEASAPAESAAAPLRPTGSKSVSKFKPIGASKGGTLLGMPPMAVYGGVAGLVLLIAGLVTVYVATKPDQGSAPKPAAVAQTSGGTAAPQPSATQPPQANGGAPAAPTPGAPSATNPPVTMPNPAPGATVPATTAPAAAAPTGERVEWRDKIPVVRLTTGKHKFEREAADAGTASDVALLEVPPGELPKPTPEEIKLALKAVSDARQVQEEILKTAKQMIDLAKTRELAPQWAELTSQGLEQVRQDIRLTGVDLTSADIQARMGARVAEESSVMQTHAEYDRLATIPGAISVLQAALRQKAATDPTGALAATLE